MNEMNKLKEIVFQFIEQEENVKIEPLGKGHINDSYKVVNGNEEYVLQRINHYVFKNVDQLQDNISRVTNHIRKKLQEKGVLVLTAGSQAIRLLPPLIISKEELDQVIQAFQEVFS